MPTFLAAPTFARAGVIAGFVLDAALGGGLTPTLTKGVLFAQGTMFRPATACCRTPQCSQPTARRTAPGRRPRLR